MKGKQFENLFKMATPDVVVGQGAPEFSSLICESFDATSDDWIDLQRRHLGGILADEIT